MTRHLDAEEILFLHFQLIEFTGGSHGVLHLGTLQSALHRSQARFGGKELIPDLFDKAAALMDALVNNHPFIDGNKRVGIAAAALFLKRNGHALNCTNPKIVDITLAVAQGDLKTAKIAAWFRRHTVKRRS